MNLSEQFQNVSERGSAVGEREGNKKGEAACQFRFHSSHYSSDTSAEACLSCGMHTVLTTYSEEPHHGSFIKMNGSVCGPRRSVRIWVAVLISAALTAALALEGNPVRRKLTNQTVPRATPAQRSSMGHDGPSFIWRQPTFKWRDDERGQRNLFPSANISVHKNMTVDGFSFSSIAVANNPANCNCYDTAGKGWGPAQTWNKIQKCLTVMIDISGCATWTQELLSGCHTFSLGWLKLSFTQLPFPSMWVPWWLLLWSYRYGYSLFHIVPYRGWSV